MRLAPQVGFRHARVITTAQFQVHEFPVAAKRRLASGSLTTFCMSVSSFHLASAAVTSDRLTRFVDN
jgi:hypothetical protein